MAVEANQYPGLVGVILAAFLGLALPPAAQASPSTEAKPNLSPEPAHRRAGCDTFDAENTPACAGARPRGDRASSPAPPNPEPSNPATPKPPPSKPPTSNQPSTADQKHAPAQAAVSPSTVPPAQVVQAKTGKVKPTLLGDMRTKGVWALTAGLAAAVALAVAFWAAAVRRGGSQGGGGAARATRPTPYRRGLVLSDLEGRSWRIPGEALTPGVCVGSDRSSLGYVNGSQIDKRHVEFWVSNGRLLVQRRSQKSVFLNDRSLSATECSIVSTGDRLRLGESDFILLIE